ncbi:hypothetical protein PV417_06570, partial [Streptomyces sp. ME19-03-3]|nr:hypothetical protein [Streptomyces sp. ME19-03-3]
MAGTTASAWWAMLPRGVREQVDGHVLRDDPFRAVSVVFEAGRNRGLSLHDAQRVVGERHDHHGDRIARTPDSPLDAESLHARAAGLPGRVVAIEAVWAGDTVHEWFVDPPAITADPAGEHRLVTIHRAAAVRYLGAERDTGRRHPSA